VWADEIRRDLELARKRKAVPRVTDNPWRALKLPRVRPTRFTFLSGEQWRAIVEVSRGTPGMAYLALCCLAGLRMKEAGHLRTSDDIDLEAGAVRIQSRDGEWPWRPKTERGERVVPMGAELRAFLTEHIERGYAGQRYLLVLPYRDQPLSAPTLAKWCKAGFEAAGVPYGRDAASLTSHSLRHTFASWLIQRDVSPLKVAELLGDTAEITMRTYAHLSPRDLTKAIAIIDDVARGG
jgi:integrase/recombinase XerD